MAAQRIPAEQDDVYDEDDGAKSNAEVLPASAAVEEEHRLVRIARQNDEEDEGGVQEVAMNVLQYEWQESLAAIALARLAHSAARRIGPEALVVSSPIVVAGESKSAGKGQNEQRWRKRQKRGNPPGSGSLDPCVGGVRVKQRRVKRRQIVAVRVELVLEGSPGGVSDESAENEEDHEWLNPPRVAAHRPAKTAARELNNFGCHRSDTSRCAREYALAISVLAKLVFAAMRW